MQHTRVLGTIGLVAATVLSAFGPGATSHAATNIHKTVTLTHLPNAVAAAHLQTALHTGYMVSTSGRHVPLSSALRNFVASGSVTSTKAKAAAHADASTPPYVVSSNRQANQDFGYYATGNGQLFHNTESIAIDPLSPAHVVVGATDTRTGSEGNNFNFGSNPSPNPLQFGAGNATACTIAQTSTGGLPYLGCDLIEALGGPGIYNSTDSGSTFTDLIIPDMLTGAVPDAISPASAPTPPPPPIITAKPQSVTSNAAPAPQYPGTAVACLSNTLAMTSTINTPGSPNGCVPYDSVGDQSVAFDAAGNLYTASLGVVNTPPGVGVPVPQTDVVINVSPAVQPLGATALQQVLQSPIGPVTTGAPLAAGRFFNAPPASPTCNPFQSSTTLCLHNEVTASNEPTDFIATTAVSPTIVYTGTIAITGNSSITPTSFVGRNWQADANDPLAGALGNGNCGISDYCLIDSPYLVIDQGSDTAYLTYTVIDFSTSSSNIYLQTSQLPGNPGQGQLPSWTAPVLVDNGFSNGNCGSLVGPANFCTSSWGAQPAVGTDGTLYIAYENGDYFSLGGPSDNQILVAYQYNLGSGIVTGTYQAGLAQDHDVYIYNLCNPPVPGPVPSAAVCNNPAGLDPTSGAYFTIPNRPSIAVTNAALGHASGVVTVVWTDQGTYDNPANGSRVVYTAFALNEGPYSANVSTITVPTDVAPQVGKTVVNQFFPWVAASQTYFPSFARTRDAIFVGFYQETPGAVTYSTDGTTQTPTATLSYYVAKSNDLGLTFAPRNLDSNMPLPNPPASAAYYDYFVGNTIPASYDYTTAQTSFSTANAVPYFGTYTGAAADSGNGAYLAYTSTRGNTHDFGVNGSQNVDVVHVN